MGEGVENFKIFGHKSTIFKHFEKHTCDISSANPRTTLLINEHYIKIYMRVCVLFS